MSRGISVGAVVLAGGGAVAVWAAVKGVSTVSGLRAVLAGHTLPPGQDLTTDLADDQAGTAAELGGSIVGGVAGIAASNNAVSAAALTYLGKGYKYRWGGGDPHTGADCSGYANYVICHDVGLAIPGYAGATFTGKSHGPVTSQWAIWSGCASISRQQVEAGDLIVWPLRHMGIAVDGNTMINSPGPNGTEAPVLSSIDGHSSLGPVVYRRLLGRR